MLEAAMGIYRAIHTNPPVRTPQNRQTGSLTGKRQPSLRLTGTQSVFQLDNCAPASMCCPRLARTTSGLGSVKSGNLAWLIDKEAIMAKKPTKTAVAPRSRKPAATKSAPKAEVAPKISKQNDVLSLLRRQQGASIVEIMEATGWQPHSVRGFMSGALKKRLGLSVISEKDQSGVRRYYVAPLKQAN